MSAGMISETELSRQTASDDEVETADFNFIMKELVLIRFRTIIFSNNKSIFSNEIFRKI